MERFLDYVLRQIVEFPDEMVIMKEEAGKRTMFRLKLRQSDIGKVVGKHGSTIAAIRNLLAAAAAKHGGKAMVEIVEDGPGASQTSGIQRPASAPADSALGGNMQAAPGGE